jgi:hypothetical protein
MAETLRKRLEGIGRECVRELMEDANARVSVNGSLPRGFPKGTSVGKLKNGENVRVFGAAVLLKAIQAHMDVLGKAGK